MANLQFTIFVVLFIFIAAISIKAETVELEKRTDSSPNNSKRNELSKRNEDKVCKCTIAEAIFDSSFKGLFFFSQDECGSTTIAGMFSRGFETLDSTDDISFEIVDNSNRTLHDLTDGLNVQFCDDGSTKPFTHTFPEINLDCNKDGIFVPEVGKYSKRAADQPPAVEVKKGKNRNQNVSKAQIKKFFPKK
ncbi:6539_t:CDS:1 [Funneliformis mosseae]|uniref:6539_t:CDS:1 n=1 Tax=Funneliformis mosseae TaxID=27381 RepID=A0A9N9ADV4_FUNMO|nr:6539_t:CDS:1 [Funneliformis mosseae]